LWLNAIEIISAHLRDEPGYRFLIPLWGSLFNHLQNRFDVRERDG